MAKRKTSSGATSREPRERLSVLATATGTDNEKVQKELVHQIVRAMWIPQHLTDAEVQDRFNAAVSLLEGIKPKGEIERLLAVQMVTTHSAAMDCLRRAMHPNQTTEGRDLDLKHAEKFLSIYARQIEALDKHRGKGQQKITVEHVTIEAGGQAMVGHIEAGKNLASQNQAPKVIADDPGQTVDMDVAAKEPVKKRIRLGN